MGDVINLYNIRKNQQDKENQQVKKYIRPFVTVVNCPKRHEYVPIDECRYCSQFGEYHMCLGGVFCKHN